MKGPTLSASCQWRKDNHILNLQSGVSCLGMSHDIIYSCNMLTHLQQVFCSSHISREGQVSPLGEDQRPQPAAQAVCGWEGLEGGGGGREQEGEVDGQLLQQVY